MQRFKTKLAKGTSEQHIEFWEIKSHSRMTRQRGKAASPAEDLAKKNLKEDKPTWEGEQGSARAGASSTWVQKAAGLLQDHLQGVSKVLWSLDVRKSVGPADGAPSHSAFPEIF